MYLARIKTGVSKEDVSYQHETYSPLDLEPFYGRTMYRRGVSNDKTLSEGYVIWGDYGDDGSYIIRTTLT